MRWTRSCPSLGQCLVRTPPERRRKTMSESLKYILGHKEDDLYKVETHAPDPSGSLPLTEDMLLNAPSGHIFGLSQNVGMGWEASRLKGKQVLILSTQGGIRNEDGTPVALGY